MARRRKEPRGRGITVRTTTTRLDFLTKIANGASVQRACQELEISRAAVYAWLRDPDDTFKAEFEEAIEGYRDTLRDEIHRRAVRGIRRAKYVGGRLIYEREYSDTLLKMQAHAHLPEYRGTPGEGGGGTGGDVINNTVNVYLSDEALIEQLRKRGLPIMLLEE